MHVARFVDGHVVGSTDVVRGVNWFGPEPQVADGHATTLLGIILEVCLPVLPGCESASQQARGRETETETGRESESEPAREQQRKQQREQQREHQREQQREQQRERQRERERDKDREGRREAGRGGREGVSHSRELMSE